MNAETSNVTVSLELIDVSKMKVDCRPPLSKRKSSRSGCVLENGENAPYLQKDHSQNEDDRVKANDSTKPLDSVENIKNTIVDRKIGADEPKLSKEESHEVRKLKDLLLLHLDLIQQQQDQLVLKNRHINQLKEENKTLKCRLERMERRMSLLKGGNVCSSSGSPARPQNGSKLQSSPVSKEEQTRKAIKRKISIEPQSPAKRFATIAQKEYEKDEAKGRIKRRHNERNYFVNKRQRKGAFRALSFSKRPIQLGRKHSESIAKKAGDKCRSTSQLKKRQQRLEGESTVAGGRFLRNRSNVQSTPVSDCNSSRTASASTPQKLLKVDSDISFIDTQPRKNECLLSSKAKDRSTGEYSRGTPSSRRKDKVVKTPKDSNIMKTNVLYYTPIKSSIEPVISPKKPEKKDEVTVPTYRIKKFVPYYVIEGTENFDDEVYTKRHQKHEAEEKKRKRWDLQRQRELEQLQKLQQKCRQNEWGDSDTENGLDDSATFRPDPDNIKCIEVCEEIPVSVFGAPIPKFQPQEFDVPWFNLEKKEKQELKKSSKSKKR